MPLLPEHAPAVNAHPYFVLRAIVVEDARDLDMGLWTRSIQGREDSETRTRDHTPEIYEFAHTSTATGTPEHGRQ